MTRIRNIASENDLNPDIAERVLRLLIDETVKNHNKIKTEE
jgi:chorismate mutase